MKLLDHYLQEVGFFLPKAQRQDMLAELGEDLRSQIDERQHELGRELDDAELQDILDRWGKPLLVAGRYLPQQYLVGPVLYPVYTFVLKVVALVYLVPWLLVWVGLMLFSQNYRGDDPFDRLSALWSWWGILLNAFFFITVGFWYMERFTLKAWLAHGVHSRTPESDPKRIPLASSILDLVLNAVFAVSWLKLGYASGIWTNQGTDGEITLGPIWHTLYWPIFLLFIAGVALAGYGLVRPLRSPVHAALGLARSSYAVLLIIGLVCAGSLLELTVSGGTNPANVENVQLWLDWSLRITLAIIGLAYAWDVYLNTRRLLSG